MGLEQVCSKKDKRLLVLLALGTLILLSDTDISGGYLPVVSDHFWVERTGRNNGLYRLHIFDRPAGSSLSEFLPGSEEYFGAAGKPLVNWTKQGRAIALHEGLDRSAAGYSISPRLAYFLGQSFSINTADIDDLTLIPGVGPSLAANIVAYREMHGPITAPQQLEKISGVGSRTRTKLQNYFTYSTDSE